MSTNHNTEPTGLDCLAFHILANVRRSSDRQTRRLAVHLANRWGGVSHYCTAPGPRHVRSERGSVATGCAVLGSLLSIIVVGVILALAVIGKAQASEGVGVTLSNHRVVLGTNLPACNAEDYPTNLPCGWNLPGQSTGNGEGLSFIVKPTGQVMYVWPSDPRHAVNEWRWVGGELRRDLRDQGLDLSVSCMFRHAGDDWSVVRCANGFRATISY